MTDIFHEIQEDLRRERLRRLWERFGGLAIAALVLILIATAGWSGYKYWRTQQAEKASASFQEAMGLAEAGKLAEAEAAFDAIAKSGPDGYKVVARFRAADAAAARDPAAGIAAFDAIASDTGLDPLARDIAQLRAGLLLVDRAGLDEVKKRVGAMATGTGPLRNSARELLALAEMKAGDAAAANKTATEITQDIGVAPGVRSRAELIRRLTAPAEGDGAKAPEAPKAAEAKAPEAKPAAPEAAKPAETKPAASAPAAPGNGTAAQ